MAIQRPLKTFGTRSYVAEVAAAPSNYDPVLANELDADLDTVYAAYNNGPAGSAAGDLAGVYPAPTIGTGKVITAALADAPNGVATAKINDLAVTNAKIADVAWTKVTGAPTAFPPSGAATGDLGSTYPAPTVVKASGTFTIPTAQNSLVWGPMTSKGRLCASNSGPHVEFSLNRTISNTQDDVTKPSWFLFLDGQADVLQVTRCAAGDTSTQVIALVLNNVGNLQIAGSTATKASGTAWANPSDDRLKKDVVTYTVGLSAILALEPISFKFNGRGGSEDGLPGMGFSAQAVESIMPEMVSTRRGLLEAADTDETDILVLDTTALPLALVNAVKELAARVTALETR